MKQIFKQRGFTLIELLVVIAIIGILASVVLASLNSARDKGADAAAKSSLNNMRAQAELFYDEPNSYEGMCDDPQIVQGMTAAENATGYPVDCADDVNAWGMEVQLKATDPVLYYCVDSTGKSTTSSSTSNIAEGTNEACN